MRRAMTTTLSIAAPAARVISYISRIENLPEWRRAIQRELHRPTGSVTRLESRVTPAGAEVIGDEPAWVEVDSKRGTVDYFWSTGTELDLASARVIPVDGGSEVVVTIFEPPPGSGGCGSLEERAAAAESELQFLKVILEEGQLRKAPSWH